MSEIFETNSFREADALDFLHDPDEDDDKYSRGVVGFITGSTEYPGAAVLGVSAALHTGSGMARFVGDENVSELVLGYRPEAVCRDGNVDAWVLGSGVDESTRAFAVTNRMRKAQSSGAAIVLDAGALDLIQFANPRTVVTPHARELSRMFRSIDQHVESAEIAANPVLWANRAARHWQVCALLKGHQTVIAAPDGTNTVLPRAGSAWLSTAGTGDVLAGAIGAVLAGLAAKHRKTVSDQLSTEFLLGGVAAAVTLHSLASHRLAPPFTALALAEELGAARRALTHG